VRNFGSDRFGIENQRPTTRNGNIVELSN